MDKQKVMEKSLSMDELDQVAGGTFDECAVDMNRFRKYTGRVLYTATIKFCGMDVPLPDAKSLARLKSAFKEYGVEVVFSKKREVANEYYINGEEVSRIEVWEHIEKQIAKGKK